MSDNLTPEGKALCLRHLRFGWWSLLCFVVLGITLEVLHANKIVWYLGQAAETRRLLWTLAHAHGTFLALVHVAVAFTYFAFPTWVGWSQRLASALLIAASVLLPGGFFLGGTFVFDGDPGLGIWLVPVGAVCLIVPVLLTAIDVVRRPRSTNDLPGADDHAS